MWPNLQGGPIHPHLGTIGPGIVHLLNHNAYSEFFHRGMQVKYTIAADEKGIRTILCCGKSLNYVFSCILLETTVTMSPVPAEPDQRTYI